MLHVVSVLAQLSSTIGFFRFVNVVAVTLWVTGFLCVLNIGLAFFYRKKGIGERLSYYVVFGIELAIFVFALLLQLGIISRVPYPLPPGLPIDRAEIGATIAIGIGLFPATYWHRTSLSEVSARIAEDAKVMKDRDGGVREAPKSAPGEWMN